MKTFCYTVIALMAFAGNSVLCRMVLGERAIDASSFTVVRLCSAVVVLVIILIITGATKNYSAKGNWMSALMLFLYAITFSFAYVSLDTGTGALVLFGAVQMTMIFSSIMTGKKLYRSEWVGVLLAFAGLLYLVLPNVTTPSFFGLVLMSLAGMAWGIYTLKGKNSIYPLQDTAFNFIRTIPLIFAVLILALPTMHVSSEGILLAVLSGSVASGLGYTVWYFALKGLSATEAAVVQLSVPIIAAMGGVIFVSERITLRLLIAGVLILGGILMVVLGRWYFQSRIKEKCRGKLKLTS